MSSTARTIGLRELLEAYIVSLSPQVHPIMTDHVQKTLLSFEVALGVSVPRDRAQVPDDQRVLFFLFQATTESLLASRTPLSDVLEGGLLVRKLDEAGDHGQRVQEALNETAGLSRSLRDSQLTILQNLMQIFLAGATPTVTMADVRATGLYPGDSPKDFDIFDHM